MDYKCIAAEVIAEEASALLELSKSINQDFNHLVEYILNFNGRIILTGIGKSGYVARKIAASLASTGSPAFYVHSTEASHGDLGMITQDDIVIILSNSGETHEIFNLVDYCEKFSIKIAAITMNPNSTIAKKSDFLLTIPKKKEALGLSAPTTSAIMMLAMGDALTIAIARQKAISDEIFRIYHPGGKIGVSLKKIADLMHKGELLPKISKNAKFIEIILAMAEKPFGVIAVIDEDLNVIGVITDKELRKYSDNKHFNEYHELTAGDIMDIDVKSITENLSANDALKFMYDNQIRSTIVIENRKLIGVLTINDLIRAGV